jgi:hypothetical protein
MIRPSFKYPLGQADTRSHAIGHVEIISMEVDGFERKEDFLPFIPFSESDSGDYWGSFLILREKVGRIG